MDGLAQREQSTLQTASVLGRSFHKKLLTETMKDVLSPVSLNLSLADLLQREFITSGSRRARSSDTPTDEKYFFTHNLTHQVVHDSLLLSQRRVLHRRAGETIESIHADDLDEHAVALAEHYEVAGDGEKAFRYLLVAGERARAVFAHAEAMEFYTRAAALAETPGTPPEDLRRLYEGLADAQMLCAHYNAALEHYERAISQASDHLAIAVLHRKRGSVFEKSGRYDDALSSFEEAMKSLKRQMDLAESARIFNGLARVYCRRREYDSAIEVGLLAIDLMKQLQDDWGLAQACSTLGVAHCAAGNLQQGIEFHQQALEIWDRLREKYGTAATLNNLGWAYQQLGDSTRAEKQYRTCIALCEEIGLNHALASACDNLSQLLAQGGNRGESISYLKKAAAILGEIQSQEQEPTPELWLQSGTL
jgi:tetratricopeptide (TPR) repeat protein